MQPQLLHLEGETFVGLRDPAGIHEGMLLLTPPAYHLTQLMNGLLARPEIVAEARQRWGLRLQPEQLDELLDQLEEHYALDNARSRGYLESLPVRPAAHAGGAYPADPQELKSFLDRLLNGATRSAVQPAEAYLIPHIDLARGRESYAEAWAHLRSRVDEFDLFVVLGISHAYSECPFILTRKDFETPLGVVHTDQEVVRQLADGLPFDPFLDEFNHLGEHSIEFQLVFLQHLAQRTPKILPILCGSFQRWLEEPGWPEDSPEVAAFVERLRLVLKDRPRVCWIASVDLAHVGERFGGQALSEPELLSLARKDMESMDAAVAADARAFLATLKADQGERNYCGTSAIYTLLQVLQPAPGQLLHYQQCNEPGLTSTVTVASACYKLTSP
jgi:MEMO1 family protein